MLGAKKRSWKGIGIITVGIVITALYLGILIALSIATAYLIISHFDQVIRFRRPFTAREICDFGLQILLIIALCGVYGIGKIRETDDQWLLKHLGIRVSAEINYQRLTQLPQINGLCNAIKAKEPLSMFHEVSVGWLARLALEKRLCKEELAHIYIQNREKSLTSVYIPLILMINQDDELWLDICKDQSFFDQPLYNKG